MKFIKTLTVIVLTYSVGLAQVCPGTEWVFSTQAEINSFPQSCSTIPGDLVIQGTVTDLSPLNNITEIQGDFEMDNNVGVTSFLGLENLQTIQGWFDVRSSTLQNFSGLTSLQSVGLGPGGSEDNFDIRDSPNLTDISGLTQLQSVGGVFKIENCASLTTIQTLPNFTTIGSALIIVDQSFSDLAGLSSLTSIGGLSLFRNSITSLNGLQNVSGVVTGSGVFIIQENDQLSDISQLNGITSIEIDDIRIRENTVLPAINGLNSLTSIAGGISINDNPNLTNIDGLSSLEIIGTTDNGNIDITNNASLNSIDGLSNINPSGINYFGIIANPMLSMCSIESICNYLNIGGTNLNLSSSNPTGCSNVQEVEDNCSCTPANQNDYDALIALYNSTNGASWTNNTGWADGAAGTDCDYCSWYGVECDINNRVTCIDLDGDWNCLWNTTAQTSGNNLNGTLPPELGNLTELIELILTSNSISGSIPSEIYNLNKLIYLVLSHNNLNGEISQDVSGLSSLRFLILNNNNFSGFIPNQITLLSNLRSLTLSTNQITGNIPNDIGNLSELRSISLFSNQLSGSIPQSVGNLDFLNLLLLGFNQLTGQIPNELGNLQSITDINLLQNQLSGNIPNTLGNLNSLESLALAFNNLTGSIPSELGNILNLNDLMLQENNLTGEIPSEFGNLQNLWRLHLFNNNLQGCIPAELQNICPNVTTGIISGNSLLDTQSWDNFCNNQEGMCSSSCTPANQNDFDALIALYNSTNGANWTNNTGWVDGATGTDCEYCDWEGVTCNGSNRVTSIMLPNNGLSGSISNSIGNLDFLEVLTLRDNNISGTIPSSIGDLSNLQQLWLKNNNISGSLPSSIGNLSNLTILSLTQNQLNDQIPSTIGGLSSLVSLSLSNNNFTGEIPSEFGDLNTLDWLSISLNSNLTGAIPATLGNLSNLSLLNVGNCNLTGAIPPELGNLGQLSELYLNNNDLEGCIPNELLALCPNITMANISGNIQLNEQDWLEFCANETGACECTPTSQNDFDALLALYNSTNGQNWTNNTGWVDGAAGTDCDYCNWYGVTCDVNDRVTCIDLAGSQSCDGTYGGGNNLTGSLPTELGNFSFLEILNLGLNNIVGLIPSDIGNLLNLEILDLGNNNLTGELPQQIGNLVSLKRLILSQNNLSGVIPITLGNLTNLEVLGIISNEFSGIIPSELGQLLSLRVFTARNNLLSGSIPQEISNLASLENLDLSINNLENSIPVEIGSMTNLIFLRLSQNNLSGSLLEELGNLPTLEVFYLNNNNFEGCFPSNYNIFCGENVNFSDNPLLSWEGDFNQFCSTSGSQSDQVGAPCDNGDPSDGTNDIILADCSCGAPCPTNLEFNFTTTTIEECEGITTVNIPYNITDWSANTTIDYTIGTTSFQIVADAPSGNIDFSPSESGTFDISVQSGTDDNNCGYSVNQGIATVVINANPSTPISSGNVEVCEGVPNPNLSVSVGAGETADWYTSSTGGTLLATNTVTYVPTETAAGVYFYYVEAKNSSTNCVSSTRTAVQFTIHANPTASVSSSTGDFEICIGESITLTASGADQYAWSAGSPNTNASITVSPTIDTDYMVTVTNTLTNCLDIETVSVIVNTLPNATISGDQDLCEGESTLLTASGGDTYNWSTLDGTESIEVMPTVNTTYTVTVTNSNNCSATQDAVVVVNSSITINEVLVTNPSCSGSNDGVYIADITTGSGTYSYTGPGNGVISGNTLSITDLSGGFYNFTVTDEGTLCEGVSEVVLTDPSPLEIDYSQSSFNGPSCVDGGDGFAVFEVDNAQGQISYSIDNSSFVPHFGGPIIIQSLTSGNHNILILDENDCKINTNFSIPETQPLELDIMDIEDPMCYNSDDGSYSIQILNGNANSYTLNDGLNTSSNNSGIFNITGISGGSYNITVTDDNGCSAITSLSLNSPEELLGGAGVLNQPTGCGAMDGKITMVVLSGGTGSYEYKYDNASWQAGTDFDGLADGVYQCFARNSDGSCETDIGMVTLTSPSGILIDTVILLTPSLCGLEDGMIEIQASSSEGNTIYYSIDGGNTWAESNVFEMSSGEYEIAVSFDDQGVSCYTPYGDITILEDGPGVPITEIIHSNEGGDYCSGTDIVVYAISENSDFYNWAWYKDDSLIVENDTLFIESASNDQSGEYEVRLIDEDCITIESTNINIAPANSPGDPISDLMVCEQESIDLFEGLSGASEIGNFYFGGNELPISEFYFESSGMYNFVFKTNIGTECEDSTLITFTSIELPSISTIEDIVTCDSYMLEEIEYQGDSIIYSFDINGYDVININSIIDSSSKIYATAFRESCTTIDSFDVAILTAPEIDLINDTILCGQLQLPSITGTNLSGQESYFLESGGINAISSITESTTVYAYDTNGSCSDEVEFTVTITEGPSFDFPDETTACGMFIIPDILTIGQNLSGDNAGIFSKPNGEGTQFTIGEMITQDTTIYFYDDNNCEVTQSASITIIDEVQVDIVGDPFLCVGSSGELSVNGNFASVLWDNMSTDNSITVTSGGIYSVIVTDANNCQGTTQISIEEQEPVIPEIDGGSILCPMEDLALSIPNTFTNVIWEASGLQTNGNSLNISEAGQVTVMAIDSNGCEVSQAINIIEEEISIDIMGAQSFCVGTSTEITIDGQYDEILWSDGSMEATRSFDMETDLSVVVSTTSGCVLVEAINITETDELEVSIESSGLCEGGAATLSVENGYEGYEWQDAAGNLIGSGNNQEVTSSGIYTVIVQGQGCTGTSMIEITETSPPVVNLISETAEVCNNDSTNEPMTLDLSSLLDNSSAGIWTGDSSFGPIADQDSEVNFEGVAAGDYVFTYTTNSAIAPCEEVEASVTITVVECTACLAIPPVLSSAENMACEGKPISISIEQSANTNDEESVLYVMHSDESNVLASIISTSIDPTFSLGNTQSAGQTYFVSGLAGGVDINGNLDLTGGSGCLNMSNTVSVSWSALPNITNMESSYQSCPGESLSINYEGAYTSIRWNQGSTELSNNQDIEINSEGSYSLAITNDEGCESIQEFTFEYYDVSVQSLGNISICESDLPFKPDDWEGQAINESGVYVLDIVDNNNCVTTQEVQVEVLTQTTRNETTDLCFGEELTYGSDVISEAGSYEIIIQDGSQCGELLFLEVIAVVDEEESDKSIREELSSYIVGRTYTPDDLYANWTNYEGIELFPIDIPSSFDINIDDETGAMTLSYPEGTEGEFSLLVELCSAACETNCFEYRMDIEIISDCLDKSSLRFPSGFTPNGDGVNDVWKIQGYDECGNQYQENEIIIWNRWGEQVFYEKPYRNQWDGTDNSGRKLPEGTYYFSAILDGPNSVVENSYVVIIR